MRRLQIRHLTEYRFPSPVSLLPHRLLLRPRENHNVRIESSMLDISPSHTVQWKRDILDNSVAVVAIAQPTDLLRIASTVIIQHYDENPFDFRMDDYALMHPFAYTESDRVELDPFLQPVYPNDREMIIRWLEDSGWRQPTLTFTLLDRINRGIAVGFSYQIREEQGVQSPGSTLQQGSGSCRDFAALFTEACRHLGLASRFVTGYLFTWAGDTDYASTHAWAEVYLPGAGWKGFDPTSGEVTGDRHIAVAVARHPEAVPPVAGDFVGTAQQRPLLSVILRVSEIAA
ncbi:MAG: transglutaminase family protein [Gammaproteobacteria bacterium]|nr:transglutaminase family protein [Gammaproteobacteria bacterium]